MAAMLQMKKIEIAELERGLPPPADVEPGTGRPPPAPR
jgi:hypothetical protein